MLLMEGRSHGTLMGARQTWHPQAAPRARAATAGVLEAAKHCWTSRRKHLVLHTHLVQLSQRGVLLHTPQFNIVNSDTAQHITALYSSTQHDIGLHDTTQGHHHHTTQHHTTLHNTAPHDTTQHSTTQHSTTRHYTTQHYTTRHYTTQHHTAPHDTTESCVEHLCIQPAHTNQRSKSLVQGMLLHTVAVVAVCAQ